ncbi:MULTISPECIES: type VI secretion system baseplate subunit TssK [Aeromonas]|jgi:type VI secretion system protein ImpJ|uniref:type VI secretion system baseplate subunit TssK n=1 Tax=Aeromonas TaxID=642 RepID=UPI0012F1B00E|nr:type VI secretion system baseplate subunit TssK [Aeromonas salmonicida]ELI6433886.1 type VI secretion system baseplate subunit TssK [Aeromonas salmonicida subsp. salmonicida]MBS2784078.1 type VI secretion system baseplate subunit TssK [Aeromonas salmonicida]MDF8331408.1 type VI secretion system baseplate subunit TssK [Aeromonas salmonicida]MDM5061770.1 type VI secretion system baseplate subunit TssK [Aeromonas salmonicida]MDM5115948.1 type VI secretion system baseplate subunit TssK [Aeromon
MSSRNRVIWREGLFIKPQHFQQQQRHSEYALHARLSALSDYFYGLQSLAINEDYLGFGRIALVGATGILPDGTVFNIPNDDVLPAPLEITDASVANQKVYLALPLSVNGVNEVNQGGQVATRLQAHRHDVRDLHSEGGDVVSLEVGRVSLRLMLEREDRSAYASLAIARILDKRPDGGLVLDPNFMPCSISVSAIPTLKRFLGESAGLVAERARSLSQRIAAPGQQGVADVAEFMMLQLLNRAQPQLSHLARLGTLHPERLHEALVQICGELMTFTDESRLPPEFAAYRHDDQQVSFEPVMLALRQALSTVLSPRAVSIQLRKHQYGVMVAMVNESELMQSADFVLAVRARMPQEQLRKQLLQQTKVASSDKIRELISLQLPGIPLLPLPVAPRQLPYHAGYSYFQLDRQSPAWQMLAVSNTLAFHIAGDFPELDMQLWAIRSQ